MSRVNVDSRVTAFLERHFPHHPTRLLAEATGLTEGQINRRAYHSGWRKDEGYMQEVLQRQANRLKVVGKPHRFKKGHKTHNKGKKMPPEVYEKIKHTMFKKGQKSHNKKPVGYISRRLDKRTGLEYSWIKVGENTWQLYHRVLWEETHGPIPRGHVVAFRDGNSRNLSIENLELITMEENAKRNSLWNNFPEEVAKAIQLRGALNRRIRNMEKKQKD